MFKKTFFNILTGLLFITALVVAGSLEPSPASPDSSQYTLENIFLKISSSTYEGAVEADHSFVSAESPAPTFSSLSDIWNGISWQTLDNSGTMIGGFYATTSLETAEPNLIADNIKSGVTIFGVEGGCATPEAVVCGGAGDSCYDDAPAMAAGEVTTPEGKTIQYVDADGSGSGTFKIWIEKVESGEARVLAGTGLDAWQEKLTANGRAHSGTEFTVDADSNNVITGSSIYLKGRTCPPNVFYDADQDGDGGAGDANDFTNESMCLYYAELGSGTYALNGDTSVVGTTGVGDWNDALSGRGTSRSWFESNHVECGNLGMRLPTIYETTGSSCTTDSGFSGTWPDCKNNNVSIFPFAEASPAFANSTGSGVPSYSTPQSWTASSLYMIGGPTNVFNLWAGTSHKGGYSGWSKYLVCALP